jgi:beta-glucosidase 2, glycosyl-hydrolase family 116 N-term
MSHFDDATFIGRFPVAEIALHRDAFPGQVQMTAFSPFIPHNERDSSMPLGLFAFEVENDTDAAIDYTIACTLGNYGCNSGVHAFSRAGDLSRLHFTSADVDRPAAQLGDLAITTQGDGVEHVDYHVRGQWFDSLSRYWREFAKAGLTERRYDRPRAPAQMWQQPELGTLAPRSRVAPGGRAQVRFAITWNYPLGAIYWFNRAQPGDPECAGDPPTWRNYYATQWADSSASGAEAFRRWGELEAATCAFRDSLFGSSHPPEIIDAVSGTLGVLRSATVIRLEGGELWVGRVSIPARVPAKAAAPMCETISRRSLGFFRRWSGRCARRNLRITSCRTAASPSASACRLAPVSTSSAPVPTDISARRSRPIANGAIRATAHGFAATGRTSGAPLNTPGRQIIPTVGTRKDGRALGQAAPYA